MNWISVKERLPGKNETVLIWYSGGYADGNAAVAFLMGTNWVLFHTETSEEPIREPHFWMPLPEPPNETT